MHPGGSYGRRRGGGEAIKPGLGTEKDDASDAMKLGLLASLILHALLSIGFLIPPAGRRSAPPSQESIPVEVWTTEQLEEAAGDRKAGNPEQAPLEPPPTAVIRPEPGEGVLPPPAQPAPDARATIRAGKILSGGVLSDPLSRKARTMLSGLDEDTRLEQLCGIEAMAQVAAWRKQFQPDRVVAYAMSDLKIEGNTILAEGAAFRSNTRWYNLRFRCEIAPDRQTVQAFEFSVGDPIPKSAWEAHSLPAIH